MNVLIPMRVSGSNSGPLTKVAGVRVVLLVIESLRMSEQDTLWLVINKGRAHQLEQLMSRYDWRFRVRIIEGTFDTRGPVETVMTGLSQFSPEDLKSPIVCLDSDSLHFDDILATYRSRRETSWNTLFWFSTSASKYAYLEFGRVAPGGEASGTGSPIRRIKTVREKAHISDMGITGAYAFSSGALLKGFATRAIGKEMFWLSEVCQMMISSGEIFVANEAKKYYDLGELSVQQRLCKDLVSGVVRLMRTRRIACRLESMLKGNLEDLENCTPVSQQVEKVRKLRQMGHRIIVTTHLMIGGISKTGNLVRDMAMGQRSLEQLQKLGIPYDEIYFSQPAYDCVVGSEDTQRDLGINFDVKAPDDAIAPRSFNQVLFLSSKRVQKTSLIKTLDGEVYFYKNIPKDTAHLFPKFYEAQTHGDKLSLIMTRISGPPYTNIFISHCLSESDLVGLLQALHTLHHSKDAKNVVSTGPDGKRVVDVDVYVNYASKVRKRFEKHNALYRSLLRDSSEVSRKIVQRLEDFERADRAKRCYCIHGDPVFSNVIRADKDPSSNGSGGASHRVILLDMRGKIGNICTLQGDAHYDLAKVLQCLYGYDFVLQGRDVLTPGDEEYLGGLRKVFFRCTAKMYPKVQRQDLLWITASHYFSLVPLHSNRNKQKLYLELCRKVLRDAEAASSGVAGADDDANT